MTGSAADPEQDRWQTEVLRRASAILGGKLVGVWEVRPDQSLAPVGSNMAVAMAENAAPRVREALRHIHMPSPPGSRWVGGQLAVSAGWCVAPVRTSAPDPPARLRERRSRGRLALELAGLCLGLPDRLAAGTLTPTRRDLPSAGPPGAAGPGAAALLDAPRAAVLRIGATVRGFEPLDPAFRERVLTELEAVERAFGESTSLLAGSRDRPPMPAARPGDFDLMPVVRSVVEAERAGAAAHGAAIEVEALGPVAPVLGDAAQLRQALAVLVHGAVYALAGRRGTVALTVADVGPVVRVTVQAPAVIPESAVAAARYLVESRFGGDLSVARYPSEPLTLVMLRLAARQEDSRDVPHRPPRLRLTIADPRPGALSRPPRVAR